MARAIVIPLPARVSDADAERILARLRDKTLGLDPVLVSGYITPAELPRELGLGHVLADGHDPETCSACFLRETTPLPGRPGWRRDRAGREWYSAAWLEGRHA